MLVTTAIPGPQDLRRIRERLGLSQAELAAALGFAASGERRVRAWESSEDDAPTPLAWTALRMMLMVVETSKEPSIGPSALAKIRAILPECLR